MPVLPLSRRLILACTCITACTGGGGGDDDGATGTTSSTSGATGDAAWLVQVADRSGDRPIAGLTVAFHGAAAHWAHVTDDGRLHVRAEAPGGFAEIDVAPSTVQSLQQPLLASDGSVLCAGAWMFLGEVGIHLWCRSADDQPFTQLPRAAADVGLTGRRLGLVVVDGAPILAYPDLQGDAVVERWSGAAWEPVAAPLPGPFVDTLLAGAGDDLHLLGFRGDVDLVDRNLALARLDGGAWQPLTIPDVLADDPQVARLAVDSAGVAVVALARGDGTTALYDTRTGPLAARGEVDGGVVDLAPDPARPGVVLGPRISSILDPNAGLRGVVELDADALRDRLLDADSAAAADAVLNPVGVKETRIAAREGRVLVAYREERSPGAATLLALE